LLLPVIRSETVSANNNLLQQIAKFLVGFCLFIGLACVRACMTLITLFLDDVGNVVAYISSNKYNMMKEAKLRLC